MMETDSQADADGSNLRQVSTAVLLIVGEPATADHKNLILGEITKGFRCWDCEDVDINEELAHIANAAELGVEGPNGERVLNYGTEKMASMIVVNSHLETLVAALKNFLTLSAPYKHLIYAGHFFSGNGAWVLQDDTFSIASFAQMCKDKEIEDAMKQQNGGQINFYFSKGGEWKADSLKKLEVFKNTVVKVSSEEKALDNVHGVLQFTAYIASFINAKTSEDLLRTSDVVGSIRFNKPTLYIFPGSEGDSSLFGVSGFNLLINGGYSRKACFWDLTRHLDRIDAFLMTHLGTDNVFGISTLLKRKSTEYIHPEIGYMYLNGSDKVSHSAVVNGQAEKEPSLCINLSDEGSRLIEYAKQLGHVPQQCTRPMTSQPLQPINLYHKVGHGSLNMYVLNPVSDSKELKDFYQHWNKHLSEHGSLHQIPIQNQLSVCTLLVWQPADPNEKITRIFFPGNAPQYKLLEGLEKMKHLDILKHASCTAKDLENKPTSAAKRNSLAARPAPSKPPVKSAEPTTARSSKPVSEVRRTSELKASSDRKTSEVKSSFERKKPEPKKEEHKPPPSKPRVPTAASLRADKVSKEDENKKTAKKDDKASKPTKTASATQKTAPKAKTETKTKKESPTKEPEKPVEKVEEEVKEKVEEKEEKKEVVEEVPNIEEPPVAVVEPMQETSLLDLSPNEPVVESGLTTDTGYSEVKESDTGDSEVKEKDNGDSEVKEASPEPLPNPTDEYEQEDTSPEELDLMGMGGSDMGNKMMESFHEGYNGDLMSNGTPTEEQGQNLNNFGIYDDNVDVQPEALPEPVEYPAQEAFSQPDMIPVNDRKNMEEKPLISGMAPIEPDVVQGLQNEPDVDLTAATTSTPLDDKPPFDFDTSEKSIPSADSEPQQPTTQDPMQQSLFGDDIPDQGSEAFESLTNSESLMSSKAADIPELDQTSEDLMQKSMTTSQESDHREDDNAIEREIQGENPPDVVQVQEKFEDEDIVESQDKIQENIIESQGKMQETIGEVDEDEISPDENDSQVDAGERNLDGLEDDKGQLDEEKVGDESPYAFENKAFHQDAEVNEKESSPEPTESQEKDDDLTEPEVKGQDEIRAEGSISPDEGVVEDKFAEEEEEYLHDDDEELADGKQSGVGIEVHEQEDEEQQVKESLDGTHEQYNDSLEVSNIPEAFEKDETPDPKEIHSDQLGSLEKKTLSEKETTEERPMESMDPYDPFCSGSPNMPSMQTSDPFAQYEEQRSSSESPVDEVKPVNGLGFDPYAPQSQNPFGDAGKQNVEAEEEEKELSTNPFDPDAEWGKPMGLPSPPPPDAGAKPPAGNGKPSSAKKTAKQPIPAKNGVKKDPLATNKAKAKLDTSSNGPSNKLNTTKTRPASAAETKSKPSTSLGKRPSTATGSSRASPAVKTPPLPPFTPFYVDLTYIPNHGNPSYSDIEFFKRVRARYYVLSSLSPNPQTLTALMEAKETWDNKNSEVTLIPTYDNDTLRHWMGLNRDKLSELNIDVGPSASRCTIHLQDHETSCSAYRLEF
ncbi:Electromotor neuron-associated protein 2,Microtubule-associated protein futsch [Mytilus coruscus]|uniref:Electromotor neuron-associated protein 2,Microtubule-associated protein futsch n=1 Tax=Mytilus coruscus TaxID=42192 RepID=A0A6J8DQP8_MYTCO|nr:Electromotor neuron-associated protein 2,Microtubule-associated protein futsch [Mytilus coruscus]